MQKIEKQLVKSLRDIHEPQGVISIGNIAVAYNDVLKTNLNVHNLSFYRRDKSVRLFKVIVVDSETMTSNIYYAYFIEQNRRYIFHVIDGNSDFMYHFDQTNFFGINNTDYFGNKIFNRFEKEYDNCTFTLRCKCYNGNHYVFESFVLLTNFLVKLRYEEAVKMFRFDKEVYTLLKAMKLFYPQRNKKQNAVLQKVFARGCYNVFVSQLSIKGYDIYCNSLGELAAFKDNKLQTGKRIKKILTLARFIYRSSTLNEALMLSCCGEKNRHYKHDNYGVIEHDEYIYYIYVKTKTGIIPLKDSYDENPCYPRILNRIEKKHKKMKAALEKLNRGAV